MFITLEGLSLLETVIPHDTVFERFALNTRANPLANAISFGAQWKNIISFYFSALLRLSVGAFIIQRAHNFVYVSIFLCLICSCRAQASSCTDALSKYFQTIKFVVPPNGMSAALLNLLSNHFIKRSLLNSLFFSSPFVSYLICPPFPCSSLWQWQRCSL